MLPPRLARAPASIPALALALAAVLAAVVALLPTAAGADPDPSPAREVRAATSTTSGAADGAAEEAAAPATPARQLPVPPQRAVPSRAEINRMIERLARQYGVERDLVHAVVAAESAYRPHAVSPVGAVGIMQVMPATAADYGVHSIDALFDTETNLRTGIRHLRRLLNRYPIGQAVMAYNAGEGALERSGGFVTYAETQRYTHRVLTSYLRTKDIGPYSPQAQALTGITLTPAMARAGASGVGRGSPAASRPSLPRQVDASRLSLRVRPTLSNRALDPAAHRSGPDSQPMFVLDPALRR